MRYALKEGGDVEGNLESLAFGISEPGFIFFVGGEMEWRGKFVGMQELRCSGHVPHERRSIRRCNQV
jgi:hypothetical protein